MESDTMIAHNLEHSSFIARILISQKRIQRYGIKKVTITPSLNLEGFGHCLGGVDPYFFHQHSSACPQIFLDQIKTQKRFHVDGNPHGTQAHRAKHLALRWQRISNHLEIIL